MSNPQASGSISRLDAALYASGSFGTGVFGTVPTVLLLYYATDVLGLAGAIAGLVILIPKLWSIVWDPLVGGWSDMATGLTGGRRPFLIMGGIGMCVTFVALFQVPPPGVEPVVWVALTYFALTCCYSVYAVPYISLPAQISPDGATLSRLVSWRMVMVMVGVLTGAALAPLIVSMVGGGARGFSAMSLIVAALCACLMALPLRMLQSHDGPRSIEVQPSPRRLLVALRDGAALPNYLRLAVCYMVQAAAYGAFSAATPFLITRELGHPESYIGLVLGAYMLATLVSVGCWSWLGSRFGLARAWKWAATAYAIITLAVGLAVSSHLPWPSLVALFAVAGIPFAGLQVLPFTLSGQMIREQVGGGEAALSGIWTAAEKLGLALGPGLAGAVLSWSPREGGMATFVCLVPPLLILASIVGLRGASRTGSTPKMEVRPS